MPQKLKQSKLTATYYSKKLVDQMGEMFSVYDGLIFIMASGIVVRVITPYIEIIILMILMVNFDTMHLVLNNKNFSS